MCLLAKTQNSLALLQKGGPFASVKNADDALLLSFCFAFGTATACTSFSSPFLWDATNYTPATMQQVAFGLNCFVRRNRTLAIHSRVLKITTWSFRTLSLCLKELTCPRWNACYLYLDECRLSPLKLIRLFGESGFRFPHVSLRDNDLYDSQCIEFLLSLRGSKNTRLLLLAQNPFPLEDRLHLLRLSSRHLFVDLHSVSRSHFSSFH
jgi:hypothetical protein